MEKLDNVAIKSTSLEMGKQIIKYFQEMGYNTRPYIGDCVGRSETSFFYGVFNGRFNCYSAEQVKKNGLTIINLPEEEKQFTKSDLKAGMWIELRNGNKYLILTDVNTTYYGQQKLVGINKFGFVIGSEFNNDLTYKDNLDCDIMKVWGSVVNSNTYNFVALQSDLIWERKKASVKTKLTLEQLAEKAGYNIDEIEITVNNI